MTQHRTASPALVRSSREAGRPERRLITILFCDLVDSSELSSRLDPEDLADLLRAYQSACSDTIERLEGEVLRYVGDGILAAFGSKVAHEDDAERAVRAALETIDAVQALEVADVLVGQRLAIRIGIASGVVLIGDLGEKPTGEKRAVTGATPNLAARLQALAPDNAVMVAPETRALLGPRFNCCDCGEHALRGFAEPVRVWRVLGLGSSSPEPPLRKFVGRDAHLGALRARWSEAQASRGRVVLLEGEPGYGKSRLVEALRQQISTDSGRALYFQCSRYYAKTALHPLIEHVARGAGIEHEDDRDTKLAKLEDWLTGDGIGTDAAPLFEALLAIPGADRAAPPSPLRQKARTFELFVVYLQRLAAATPLLIVVEDAHWIDPTTMELLRYLVTRVRRMRVLLVVTYRPEGRVEVPMASHVEHRELERLAHADAMELAAEAAGGALPRSVVAQVVEKAAGVPLFVEELTRALLEGGGTTAARHGAALSVPTSLRATLTSRLDQLGEARGIAEHASAIGREFSMELLEAVVDLTPRQLQEGLGKLQSSGVVREQERVVDASHAFTHELIRDVAYDEMTREQRREIHRRIAAAIESGFPQTALNAPELVARHWTDAAEVERAVAAWLVAGRRASERSEHAEAIARLREGLKLVEKIPDAEDKRQRELEFVLLLGTSLITKEGGGLHEVNALYARALELCADAPECASHFAAYWGWWRANMDLRHGRAWADKLLVLARTLEEPAILLQAHHCEWATLYMTGAHEECCRHIEAGLALYDRDVHHADAATYGGHDARVCALGELALARWLLGYPGEALRHAHAALAWADELQHVGSRAHALDYALVLHKFRREPRPLLRYADELIALAAQKQLRDHHAKGLFFRGWARAMSDEPVEGLEDMLCAREAFHEVGTPEDISIYYEMLAEVYMRERRFDDAFVMIDDAFAQTERCGILFWTAELHRRRGELLVDTSDYGAAAKAFEQALESARAQRARSLELRAARSFARLRQREGRMADAVELLRPVYEGFDEGHDTPDLLEARAFLERA